MHLPAFPLSSYDIEDAIVMNKYSLDRGFGRCIVLKKYGVSLKKYANRTMDRIVAPVPLPGKTEEGDVPGVSSEAGSAQDDSAAPVPQ